MEKRKPTISVLIRTHNAINRIATCLESVYYKQFVYPDKIFICDDFSTDGTYEYLSSKCKDERVCILRNDSNKGPGYSLRRLIYTCDTDYYLVIDDDDYWVRTDVIQVIRQDIVSNEFPDKIYYRSNDNFCCRLHVVFAYKTAKMQQLTYFPLWRHEDDYTLQTLNDNFKEVIIDDYVFYCPYVPHSVSQLQQSMVYRYLHKICKDIYMGRYASAKHRFYEFPYLTMISNNELNLYHEIYCYFNNRT